MQRKCDSKNTKSFSGYFGEREKPLVIVIFLIIGTRVHPSIIYENWFHTGIISIKDLLRFDVEKVHVTGFTFYQTPNHYSKAYNGWTDEKSNKVMSKVEHKPNLEFVHFVELCSKDSRIDVDALIASLIEKRV